MQLNSMILRYQGFRGALRGAPEPFPIHPPPTPTTNIYYHVSVPRNAAIRFLVLPSSLPIHHPPQYKILRNEHMGCGEGWGKSGFGVLGAKKNESRRLRARKLCHKILFRTKPEYSTLSAAARRRAIRQLPVTVTNYRFAFRHSHC